MGGKQYLQVVAVSAASITLLYILLFLFQLGAPVPAEYWVREVKIAKQYLAHQINVPKIVILGGSNALFGVDSALIERETGFTTFNMSLHGGLDLAYLVQSATPVLKKGDTLVLALEFSFYTDRNSKLACFFTSWYANNLMAWDSGYITDMPLMDKACLVTSVPPERVLNGALTQLYSARLLAKHRSRRLLADNEVIRKMGIAREWARQNSQIQPTYGLARMNVYGDFLANAPLTYFETPDYGFDRRVFAPSSRNWKTLSSLKEYCRAHGIRLIISWPPTIDDSRTGAKSPSARPTILRIRCALEEIGIPILGDPEDFSFDREYFLDTKYHLNATGGRLRTKKLIHLLKPLLAAPPSGNSTPAWS
jgi:hypothetical protein